MLSVTNKALMLSVSVLSVVMLSVVMLSVIILNVVAPLYVYAYSGSPIPNQLVHLYFTLSFSAITKQGLDYLTISRQVL